MTIDFDPYAQSFANNPYPVYKQLRDQAPVFYQEKLNFWAISRYEDVLEAHRDFATFSSTGGVTIEDMGSVPLLITKDPPDHRWHKALITKVFSQDRMMALGPYILELVTKLLDEAAQKDEFDFVQEFALEIPLEVISELIGIPKEMRRPFHDLSNQMLDRGEGSNMEKTAQIAGQQIQMFMGLVQERRANPRQDPISYLIETEVQDETGKMRRLDDFEMAFRFLELAAAGHETVAKAIPNGAIAFHRFSGERAKVQVGNAASMGALVEEVLRFDPPSQLQGRTTTRDVELHGKTIPKGSKTMLLTGAATRDERKFEDPDTFNITRDAPLDAVFFGYGIHRCLGIHLARLEIRTAFEQLFKRFPNFEVDPSRATRAVLSNVRGVSTLPARLGKAA